MERNTEIETGVPKTGKSMLAGKHNADLLTESERGELHMFWNTLYDADNYWLWEGVKRTAENGYEIDHVARINAFLNSAECAWENFPNWAHVASVW